VKNVVKGLIGARDPELGDGAGPVSHNGLEALLWAAAADPSLRPQFERALLTADLLAATPAAPGAGQGWRTLAEDEAVSLLNVAGPDGGPVVAVFTSEQRVVDAFGPGAAFIQMDGATMLGLVADGGALLNPGSDCGVYWSAGQLAILLGRPIRRTVTKGTEALLGVPAEPPEELLAALRRCVSPESGIREAWLASAHWPEADEWSWYLDVRTELADGEVQKRLSGAFQAATLGGRPLDMIICPPSEGPGLGIRIVPTQSP
jgi:hypothetical protein